MGKRKDEGIMKAVITVLGSDRIGIIAAVTAVLAEAGANILDISQTIMQDIFTMIMMVDLSGMGMDIGTLQDKLAARGAELGVEIRVQRDDIFRSMHRI
jgi:ACT domain-containing protein